MKINIIGMRIEKYIGTGISGHNCNFQYFNKECEKHILLGINMDNNNKIKIEFSNIEMECQSGWCVSNIAEMNIVKIKNFGGYTFRPKKKLILDLDLKLCENNKNYYLENMNNRIENDIFIFDELGDDKYYPTGFYQINTEQFEKTIRHRENRLVWIFKGKSNVGKSFLANKLKKMTIYETDYNAILPDEIIEDVVVIGNKYNFTIEDIKKNIFGNFNLILVDFKELP
jgi:hypothetical protein